MTSFKVKAVQVSNLTFQESSWQATQPAKDNYGLKGKLDDPKYENQNTKIRNERLICHYRQCKNEPKSEAKDDHTPVIH